MAQSIFYTDMYPTETNTFLIIGLLRLHTLRSYIVS